MAAPPNRLPHITVFGSLNMDLVAYVPHHPLPGETLTADRFATSPGGKGANQAVACAKLSRARPSPSSSSSSPSSSSARVSMVGCVGADAHGAQLRANLAAYGVDVARVEERHGVPTGAALIIVDAPSGENRIVVCPGANHALTLAGEQDGDGGRRMLLDRLRIPAAASGDATSTTTTTTTDNGALPDLLVMQLEIPFETVLAALEAARAEGADVLLNPAPARKLPEAAYRGLAHLVVNETEAAVLGELAAGGEDGGGAALLESEAGLERVARGFVARGVRNVVITLGGRGVYYMSADGRKGLIPAEKAAVVDTTAAGDTFVGCYALDAVGKKDGEFDIERAVRRANRAAAKTVERPGAQDSIPWLDELE